MHAPAQPLHLQLPEVVFLVVLNNDLLQLVDLSLHLAPQLSLHFVQGLEKGTRMTNANNYYYFIFFYVLGI